MRNSPPFMSLTTRNCGWSDADVNSQALSPLFRCPPEIRQHIWTLALSDTTHRVDGIEPSHDFRPLRPRHVHHADEDEHENISGAFLDDAPLPPGSSYGEKTDWARLGYTGRKAISAALLRTCRLIFRETRDLPMATHELCFWYWRRFDPATRMSPHRREIPEFFRYVPSRYQANRIQTVHVFPQFFWMDHYMHEKLGGRLALRAVRRFHITLRRGDWTNWENNRELAITPFHRERASTHRVMLQDMEKTAEYCLPGWEDAAHQQEQDDMLAVMRKKPRLPPHPLSFPEGGWATALAMMPSLEELVFDFDTSADKRTELDRIVKWAHRTWHFPLGWRGDKFYYLYANDTPFKVERWQGLPCHWSESCPDQECNAPWRGVQDEILQGSETCSMCSERCYLLGRRRGPLIYTYTVTWKLRVDEGREDDRTEEQRGLDEKRPTSWPEARDDTITWPRL